MNAALFTAFWAVSMLFVVTPGVDWAYTISAGMRERVLLPAIGGLLLGHLVATLIVAAGVGALIAGVPLAMAVLTVFGAAYLFWLGVGLLRNPPVPQMAGEEDIQSATSWVLRGFCVSGLNPKVLLLFLALLPQFTERSAGWPISAQIAALGGTHVLNCGVVYLIVGYSSRAVLRARPQAAKIVGRVSGVIMIVLAIVLILERFFGAL
ncbi:LysE family translocator [Sphingobium sp. WW5]|uniref:Putative threonine efflux protein n=1 Tax=Sphingobium yanoikuyae TaxID=13690 RepID=A0A084EFX6_SPHYA|nr:MULTISPECIES: LysE family translocator [Sphingobium]KEZ16868.1 putative threonine efflux protein [Sphingobium yanoikuyae]KZC75059.1 lysine transporter LysE [Sphingobium yanoikuyae]TKV41067.1 lysine transporter LysE [Sphingobium sp. MP9-4]